MATQKMNDQNSLIGLQVDNFKIKQLLGSGGMASVYLAADESLKRDVVLKVLLPTLVESEELRQRFQREAQATAQLHHPNIVQVYTTGRMPDGSPYIALQYVEGGSLSDLLQRLAKQGQWISIIYALSISRQMADALQVAHQANIVHRDLKPSNILLRTDGTPILSDLGIAAIQQATLRLTQTGGVIGTPNYMSPEQASSQVIDGRSDIYSLGVILYELLSGRLPFDADSPWAMLHQHIYEQPMPLAQVRPDLTSQTVRLVETCLQKNPEDRFPNAQALAAALDRVIAAENANPLITISASQLTVIEPVVNPVPGTRGERPAQPTTTSSTSEKRPWWPYALISGGLLLLLAVTLFLWQRSRTPTVSSGASSTSAPMIVVVTATSAPLPPTPTIAPTAKIETRAVEETVTIPAVQTTELPDEIVIQLEETTAPQEFAHGLIAYSCGSEGQSQIYLYGPASGEQIPLVGQPRNSVVPAFSRDGTKIAYRSNEPGAWQIYVSDIDGANKRQVTSGTNNNYEAAWSPDDGRFAFVSDRTGSKQIYIMDSDGANQQQLTFNNNYNDDPSWSITDQIAYESDQDGRFNIYRLSPQGGVPLLLVDAGSSSSTPAWSADGTQVAFESRTGDLRQIWIATADGTNLRRITSEGSSNERPAWSPDGRRLAFHSNYQQSGAEQFDIWVIDIESSVLQRLTSRGDCYDPAWGRSLSPR